MMVMYINVQPGLYFGNGIGFLDENGQIRWDKEKTQGIDKQAFLIIRFVLIVNIWLYVEVLVFMLGGNVLGIKIILNVRTKKTN